MSGHRKFAEIRTDRDDPGRRERVAGYRQELREAMSLGDVRRARELTQAQLGMGLERQTDLYVSTLRSYVEAMGGELVIEAQFDDRRLVIGTFSSLAQGAKQLDVEAGYQPEEVAAGEPSGQ